LTLTATARKTGAVEEIVALALAVNVALAVNGDIDGRRFPGASPNQVT
jgi:hypothetical protein